MKRVVTLSTWLFLMTASPLAPALLLGDAQVNSPIGSPLRVTAPLLDAPAGAVPESIDVSIASEAAFEARGMALTPLVQGIRAEVKRHNGALALDLSSRHPASEPWFDLLLEFRMPGGERETHELTLLLDPPGYDDRSSLVHVASSPRASSSSTGAPGGRRAPDGTSNSISTSTPGRVPPVVIQRGDTLWSLAKRMRASGDDTVQQIMAALVKANPHAFPTGDPGVMRAGATLRLPFEGEPAAQSQTERVRQVDTAPEPKAEPEPGREPEPDVEPKAEMSGAALLPASIAMAIRAGDADASATADAGRLEELEQRWKEGRRELGAMRSERDALEDEVVSLQEQNRSLRVEVENPPRHSMLLGGVLFAGLLLLLWLLFLMRRRSHQPSPRPTALFSPSVDDRPGQQEAVLSTAFSDGFTHAYTQRAEPPGVPGKNDSIEYQAPDIDRVQASTTDAILSSGSLEQHEVAFTPAPHPARDAARPVREMTESPLLGVSSTEHGALPDGFVVEVVEYSLQDSSLSAPADVGNRIPRHANN